MKRRKNLVVYACISCVCLLGLFALVLLNPFNSEERRISSSVQKLGDVFYTDFFYPQQVLGLKDDEIVQKLTYMAKDGIRISVGEMSKISEINDTVKADIEIITTSTELVCNAENTLVHITPKEPFAATDYDLEVILDCNK